MKKIKKQLTLECVVASTFAQARKVVEDRQVAFSVAILDLVLPDAPRGEIVDYIVSKKIPAARRYSF
ncbi:MAG: hypothetical protein GY697_21270 [Desulfobacterales bacterium]|nr:hypothetical protein [Desulfobacterales bacterium]